MVWSNDPGRTVLASLNLGRKKNAMTTSRTSSGRHIPGARTSPLLKWAWIFVALIPVAFVVALVVGEGLLDTLGYPGGEPNDLPPMGVTLLVGVPLTLLTILPGAFAAYFGWRARQTGDNRGTAPAAIGAISVLYMLFASAAGILQRLVDRLVT